MRRLTGSCTKVDACCFSSTRFTQQRSSPDAVSGIKQTPVPNLSSVNVVSRQQADAAEGAVISSVDRVEVLPEKIIGSGRLCRNKQTDRCRYRRMDVCSVVVDVVALRNCVR